MSPAQVRALKRDLTAESCIRDFVRGRLPPPLLAWQESACGQLCIPRFYGLQRFGAPHLDILSRGDPMAPQVCFVGHLREDQQEPGRLFMEAAHDPIRRGGILSLPTGFGKTTLAIHLMCQLRRCSLVVVHKTFLMDQWRSRIQQFAPAARIGRLQGATIDVENKDFVLGMLQTLCSRRYPEEVLRRFGLICVDECHHMGAEVFSRTLRHVVCNLALGLSATVERADGLSKVFMWHLGGVVCSIRGREGDHQVRVLPCDYRRATNAEPITQHLLPNGKPNVAQMLNDICADRHRTTAIAALVTQHQHLGRKVLVLSDRRAHIEELATHLRDCGMYYGGLTPHELGQAERCSVVLGTFAMAQEGLDIRGLDTLVLATPKSNVIQAVGRILRDAPHQRTHQPLVLDVVDGDYGVFLGQAHKRRSMYRTRGFQLQSTPLTLGGPTPPPTSLFSS
jgi:superfamily II DNA or RNA helicase